MTTGQRDNRTTGQQGAIIMITIVGLLIFLRFSLSNRLPAYIIADSPHDDGWMVQRAAYLLQGAWMGPYDQYTLIKGVFSPLLMAFSVAIGVTFRGLNTALYCFSCLIFVIAVRPILKRRWTQLACFVMLLFNPITYALQTGQRIYRNGMSQWQLLLIFGCLMALFLRRGNGCKSLVKWALLGGAALSAFFQTREDGVWAYPFVIVAIIATIIACLLEKKCSWKRILLFVLPLVLVLVANAAVAAVNNIYYGAAVTNDRDGGNYAKVMQDLYLIEPDAGEDELYQSEAYQHLYYNIYVSTVEKAFSASPTFASAAQPIRDAITLWDSGEELQDGEPFADHILFAIRDGVKGAGYYQSLPETEVFYGKVHQELRAAFQDGRLQKRGVSLSAMAAPLKKGDLSKTFALLPEFLRTVVRFEGVSSAVIPAAGSDSSIKRFSLLSGGDYYNASSDVLKGSGWALAYDNEVQLTAALCDADGKVLYNVPFVSGSDVFDYFTSAGVDYVNAKNCRFSFALEGYDLDRGLTLRFTDSNGRIYRQIPVDGTAEGGSDGEFQYAIDMLTVENERDYFEEFYARFVNRANAVIRVYQSLGVAVAVLACLSYLGATLTLMQEFRRKQKLQTLSVWLLLTGVALSLLLFLLCMCYMSATTFFAGGYLYQSSAYVLLLMFCGTAICWVVNALVDMWGQKVLGRRRA